MRHAILVFFLFLLLLPGLAVKANNLPDEAMVSGVVGHAQTHNLSCEARSASDWAAFFGYHFSEDHLLSLLPYTKNPETGFVGKPDAMWGNIPPYGYGVHPPPLAAVLRSLGVPARDVSGVSWEDLRREIVAGRPVIIWVVGQMITGVAQTYTAPDGQAVRVAAYEHTMILVGYTTDTVEAVDAYSGLTLTYSQAAFLKSWETMGRRAILYTMPKPVSTATPTRTPSPSASPTPTLTPTPTETSTPSFTPTPTLSPTPTPSPTPPTQVIVNTGDTLLGLAQRFNLTWEALVAVNGMKYPYFIYPGDVLRLPPGAWEVATAVQATLSP